MTEPKYKTPHVHTAIASILSSLSVEKNGVLPANMGGKGYITAVDVASEIKRKLVEQKVISLPRERETRKEIINNNGRLTITSTIEAEYTLLSTEDGSSVSIQGVGDGVATGSAVASNIASTNAFKNAFLRAFLITEQSVEDYAKNGPDADAPAPRTLDRARTNEVPNTHVTPAGPNAGVLKRDILTLLGEKATVKDLEPVAIEVLGERAGEDKSWQSNTDALSKIKAHLVAKAEK